MKKYWIRNRRGHFYCKPGMKQVRMGQTIKEARIVYDKIQAGEIKLERLSTHPQNIERLKKQMYFSMQNRAARKGFGIMAQQEFDRLWEYSGGRCAITHARFSMKPEKGKFKRPWAPSIDRIDVTKGYEFTNCRLVCTAVNLAMNEWGEKVLFELVRRLAPVLDIGSKVEE